MESIEIETTWSRHSSLTEEFGPSFKTFFSVDERLSRFRLVEVDLIKYLRHTFL